MQPKITNFSELCLQGAFLGVNSGLAFILWIFIGSRNHSNLQQYAKKLPLSTANCSITHINHLTNFNFSTFPSNLVSSDMTPNHGVYALSYTLYTPVGFCCTLVVGITVSLITGDVYAFQSSFVSKSSFVLKTKLCCG